MSIFLVLSMLIDLIPIFLVGRASRASSIAGEVLALILLYLLWLYRPSKAYFDSTG